MIERTAETEKQVQTEQPGKSSEQKQKEKVKAYTPDRGFRRQRRKNNFLNSWKFSRR